MNLPRLALAALAATLADAVYGVLVYNGMMSGTFLAYPGVFRSPDSGAAALPVMFAGIFVGMCAAAYLYARAFGGRGGPGDGLRFGLLMAVFNAGYFIGVDYGILNIGGRLALAMAFAGLGEWLVAGSVIGLVYKPARV